MRLNRWLAGYHGAGDNIADGNFADLNDPSTADVGPPFTIFDPGSLQTHLPELNPSTPQQDGSAASAAAGAMEVHEVQNFSQNLSHDFSAGQQPGEPSFVVDGGSSGSDQFVVGHVTDHSGSFQLVTNSASGGVEAGSVTVTYNSLASSMTSIAQVTTAVTLSDTAHDAAAAASTSDQPLVPVDPAPNSEVTVVHNTSTASNNFGAVFGVAYLTGGNTVLVGATPPGSNDGSSGGNPVETDLQVAIVNGSNVSFVDIPLPGGSVSTDYIGGASVTALTNGNFAVLYWGSNASNGGEGAQNNDNLPDYYVQVFTPGGTPVGGLITLDSSGNNNVNGLGWIAEDPANNGFVVSTAIGDEVNVVVQRFSNSGTPGASFTIPGGYGYAYVDPAGNIVETYQKGPSLTNYYAFIPASATSTSSSGVLLDQPMPASTYLNFTPDASGSGFVAFYFSGTNLMAQTLSAAGALGSPITVANVGSIATNDRPWSVVTTSDGEYAISLIPNANGLYTEYPGTNQVIKVGPSLTAAATTIYDLTTSGGSSAVQMGPWAVAGPNGSIISYNETAGNGTSTHGVALEATVTAVSYLGSTGPVVTAANIHVSGGSGTGGAFKIGDTVTTTWNNSAGGDNNTDPVNGATFDFSQFGGGSAVTATNNGGIWTATYHIAAGSIDTTNAHVAVTATDTSSNATTTSGSAVSVDDQQPTVTVSASSTVLHAGDAPTVTFAFSETVSDFSLADVTLSGGTLSGLTHVGPVGGHDVYTATFTPTTTNTEVGSVHVNAGSYTDHVGNTGSVSNTVAFSGDTQAPTVTLSVDHNAVLAGQTATVTFTFSDPNPTFSVFDVHVTGGSLGNNLVHVGINGAGQDVYTDILTPAASDHDVTSVSVPSAIYSDAAGNLNESSNTIIVSGDTLAPTVTITPQSTVLHAGDTQTVTFTFSEAVDFSLADATVSGGVLANLTQTAQDIYTATFTPDTTNTENGSVQLNAGSYTDTAGNAGGASNTVTFTGDTQAPTVTLSADHSTLLAGQIAKITFTFSDPDPTFSLSNVAVIGGSLGNLVHVGPDGSGNDVYTAIFAPDLSNQELASLVVGSGIYSDAAGNQNAASNTISISGDTLPPSVVSVAANPNTLIAGQTSTVTFTFSEALASFALSDVSVSGGTLGSLVHAGLNGSNQDVYTAIFTPDVSNTELGSVRVITGSYTDIAGNVGVGSNPVNITGDTQAPTAPTLALHQDTGVSSSDHVTNNPLIDYTKSDPTDTLLYKADGAGSFSTTLPVFATDGSADGPHTVSVEEQDAAGNVSAAASLSFTLDTLPPTMLVTADHTALVPGQTATVTFDFSEAVAGFSLSDVQLSGGALSNLVHSGIHGGDDIYTATFTPQAAVHLSDTLSVTPLSYADVAGNEGIGSNTITFTGDTNIPAAPRLALDWDSGVSATDHITKDPVIDVFKSNSADTLLFKVDNATSFTSTVPVFATNGSADGVHTVSVEEVDAGGNASAASSLTFTLDTTAPQLTGITASPGSGSAMTGSTVQLTVGFNEAVTVIGGTPTLTLNDGGSAIYDAAATALLGDRSKLVFDHVVSATDQTSALAVTGFSTNGAAVSDVAGNHPNLSAVTAAFNALEINETSAPAYTSGGITRPELHFDSTGHILLDAAATAFEQQYGVAYLYLGLPPGTPYPPVPELHA